MCEWPVLRDVDWQATAILDVQEEGGTIKEQLVDLIPGTWMMMRHCWVHIDIGTTTVTLWLVELITGKVEAQVSEYNGKIALCGTDFTHHLRQQRSW